MKNLTIGLLIAAIVIIVGGYFVFIKTSNKDDATPTTTTNPPVSTNPTATPPDTTPPITLSAPTVETSQNVATSSSTALVTGSVNPNGLSTTYWFEYANMGTTPDALSEVLRMVSQPTYAMPTPDARTTTQQIGGGFSSISSPAYITGLKANSVYVYKLSAKNNLGTTGGRIFSFKTDSTPAPKVSLPTASTNSATNISRVGATLNGQVNPNGFLTNYWFEYGKSTSFGDITLIKSTEVGSSQIAASNSLLGLAPLTKYYFRLNAQNQFGTVNGNTTNFTTLGPLDIGTPTVTTSQATKITNLGADLNGKINPNGAVGVYWFEYSKDSLLCSVIGTGVSGCLQTTFAQTFSATTNTVNAKVSVKGLDKNTKYYYHLTYRNQDGVTYVNGNILSFTTKP